MGAVKIKTEFSPEEIDRRVFLAGGGGYVKEGIETFIPATGEMMFIPLESTYRQLSKALCGKENATPGELLNAVSQVKNRIRDLEYALALMVSQYCRDRQGNVTHLWMTAGEHAFAALGIENYSSVEVVDEMIDRMEESMKEAPHADDP